VQPNGVAIEGIQYYSDVLRRFIGATERGQKRQFLFRRESRDISVVHFWDPEVRRYSTVPCRNIAHPLISVWELRELRRKLHESGTAQIDEVAIFAAYERLRDREARAANETKRVRRARERRPNGAPPHPKTHRMPNLLVFGETNNGKTALIQRFVLQHLPKLGADRTLSRIPVVVIQAPSVPEERRFY
jgi:hypothetical protein